MNEWIYEIKSSRKVKNKMSYMSEEGDPTSSR